MSWRQNWEQRHKNSWIKYQHKKYKYTYFRLSCLSYFKTNYVFSNCKKHRKHEQSKMNMPIELFRKHDPSDNGFISENSLKYCCSYLEINNIHFDCGEKLYLMSIFQFIKQSFAKKIIKFGRCVIFSLIKKLSYHAIIYIILYIIDIYIFLCIVLLILKDITC